MKKISFLIFIIVIAGSFAMSANAQMMSGFSNSSADWNEVVEHTLREEKEGKNFGTSFKQKKSLAPTLAMSNLVFSGEYFMGTMMGDSHAVMNAMMI